MWSLSRSPVTSRLKRAVRYRGPKWAVECNSALRYVAKKWFWAFDPADGSDRYRSAASITAKVSNQPVSLGANRRVRKLCLSSVR